VTRIAKQRASLTKSLLSEQMRYKGTGSKDDLAGKSLSMSGEAIEDAFKSLVEEGDFGSVPDSPPPGKDKKNLRDFKRKVASGSRHQSLTVGALSMEALRESKEHETKPPDSPSTTPAAEEGGKRTRNFVGRKRNSLQVGEEPINLNPEGSPQTRKPSQTQSTRAPRPLPPSHSQSMDQVRTPVAGYSSRGPSASAAVISNNTPSEGEASPGPKMRKFASLKRENYKDI